MKYQSFGKLLPINNELNTSNKQLVLITYDPTKTDQQSIQNCEDQLNENEGNYYRFKFISDSGNIEDLSSTDLRSISLVL